MARSNDNLFTKGTRGAVGKQIVYKKINGKTFAAKYPDMSGVEYNSTQKGYQNLFAQAVKYAQEVQSDPERVAAYNKKIHNNKKLRETSVYHAALKAFMAKHSKKKPAHEIRNLLKLYNEKYKLDERAIKTVKYLIEQGKITNSIYQQVHDVSKPTATRGLQKLVRDNVIIAHSTRAGSYYTLVDINPDKDKNIRDGEERGWVSLPDDLI